MHAVQFSEYGSADVLRLAKVLDPQPGTGEVRIRVAATGVNPADHKWRSGLFRDKVPIALPHIPGCDVAGTIDRVGDGVVALAVGERVFAKLDPRIMGGYAELVIARASWVAKVPAGFDLARAAALPTPALTGMQMIAEHVRPNPGETVLITGAVGAVGRFAVHTALQLGAQVIAATRASQREQALSLGASQAFVLGEEPPADMRFDHIADTVGGAEVAALGRLMGAAGRIVTVATSPIDSAGLEVMPLFVAVHPDGAALERIGKLVAGGVIPLPPIRMLPLSEAAKAHRMVEAGRLGEKIILRP